MPELVEQLKVNTLDVSLAPFAPELAICATIVLLLLVRLFDWLRWLDAFYIALAGTTVALLLLVIPGSPAERIETFGGMMNGKTAIAGMLVVDGFGWYVRLLLLGFAVLFVIFTRLSGMPQRSDATDFYALFLGSTVGMCLMASANHMLTVFLGVEMASVPSYALAGILRKQRSSEAALKYAVYGAGAAGVMVYGISLLSGITHSAHLPTMAAQLADMFHNQQIGSGEAMVLGLGGLMVMVGLAFKLSAVPFHFWCPDVFEGAAAEIGAFLSVASKAAALALLVRVALGLGVIHADITQPAAEVAKAAQADQRTGETDESAGGAMNIQDENVGTKPADTLIDEDGEDEDPATTPIPADKSPQLSDEQAQKSLAPVRTFAAILIAVIAAITCTFGNLAAYAQTNMKRLLAYSTIAHAGYMMMAVPPAIIMAQYDPAGGRNAIGALSLYLAVYLFMNLGAFAIVAFLRNQIGSEEIDDYAGLVKSCPGVVVCMVIIMFSLVGMPPLAGFLGKFAIFAALVDGYRASGAAGHFLLVLLVIGGLNTAISLFYYLRVAKVMTIDPEPDNRAPVNFPLVSLPGAFIAALTIPILLLMLSWDWINELARTAAQHLM